MQLKYKLYIIIPLIGIFLIAWYFELIIIHIQLQENLVENYFWLLLNALVMGMYTVNLGFVNKNRKIKYIWLIIIIVLWLLGFKGIQFEFGIWFLSGIYSSNSEKGINFFVENLPFFLTIYVSSFTGESDE